MGVCVSKGVVAAVESTNDNELQENANGATNSLTSDKDSAAFVNGSRNEEVDTSTESHKSKENSRTDLLEYGLQRGDIISPEELKCREVIKKNWSNSFPRCVQKVLSELEQDIISEINMFVFTVPNKHNMSAKDLAQSLTASTARYIQLIGSNDRKLAIAKYYAIYSWICCNISVDIQAWRAEINGNCNDERVDIESILENSTSTAYGFALLFSAICNEAGLAVEIIKGSIRWWQSLTGELFQPGSSNVHCWNTVVIQDKPFVVDTMMGSGYISFNIDFIKEFNTHYFAAATNYSILTHWPEITSQQYLETSLSLQEIQPVIPVDAATLHLGVIPFHWCENMQVSASDPVASITLESKQDNTYVRAVLLPMFQEYDETMSQSLVYVHKLKENCFKVDAVLPSFGKFSLNIYLPNSSFQHKIFLSYVLTCKGEQCYDKVGYPFIFSMAAYSFNFKLLKWNSEEKPYVCKHTKLTPHSMDFEADQDLSFHHCIVDGKCESLDDVDQTKILLFNTMVVNRKNGKYQLLTVFPSAGWWTVHLSAGKECDEDGTISGYTKLLTYSIYVENGKAELSYPHILKPNSVFFGSDPIDSSTSEPMKISFGSNALDWVCSVSSSSSDNSLEGYATVNPIQSCENNVNSFQLMAVFPKPGTWFVLAYGQLVGNDSYTAMFKLKLSISKALQNKCLIRIFSDAKNNYSIHFADSGMVSFYDNGKPFSFSFTAPSTGIRFLPRLEHQEKEESSEFATFLSSQALNSEQSEYKLSLLFPESGSWKIELYATSTLSGNSKYDLVATLNLMVTVSPLEVRYPKVLPFFHDVGMVLEETDALIPFKCSIGKLKLPFRAPPSTTFLCSLENSQSSNHPQLAYIQHTKDTREFNLHAVFPELGEWKISLYAREESLSSSGTSGYTQVLEFPITNTTETACVAYPQIFDGFYKFKIYFADENIPLPSVLRIGSELGQLLVTFYSPKGISFLHYATVNNSGDQEHSDTGKRRMTTMVSDRATRSRTIQVNADCPGEWIVYLFAETRSNKDAEWMPILQYKFMATVQKC